MASSLKPSTSSLGILYSSLTPSEVMVLELSVTAVTIPTSYISLIITPLSIMESQSTILTSLDVCSVPTQWI